MKNIKRSVLLIIVGILVSSSSLFAGGKGFQGIVIYNISYDDDLDPQMATMMPKTLKLMIKGNKSRTEMNTGFGTTIVLFDGDDKSSVVLIDMMGQKFAMKMSHEEMEKENEDVPETVVEITDETKEIAGYTCKKALVKSVDETDDFEEFVYFTDELGSGILNSNNPLFEGIDGVMLEYANSDNDVNMKMEAISVEKKKISDDKFEIPEGYKIVTQEELQNMFGG
jgi:GLPGLI family protein